MERREGNTIPSILVVSCSDSKSSKELIAEFLQGVCSPEPDYTEENIDGYKWKLNTKYYTASVKLCAPKHRTVPSPEFAESVEAVLLYFRPQSRQEFVVLQSWLRTIDQVYSPAVKLLVCDHSGEGDEVPRHELFNFAIDRHLELIELAPLELESDDEDFGGVHGFSRVRGALSAHTWSNLEMKAGSLRKPVASHHDEGGVDCAVLTTDESAAQRESCDANDSTRGSSLKIVDSGERDVDVFEQLFSRLHQFRNTAESLSGEERKNYAEQVTKQFWKSMGDDSDEFSDSD